MFIQNVEQHYISLENEYRNEYFFKNTLFNNIFLRNYSLNTAVALSEIKVAKSKPDFVIINNLNSIVYEIKTDLDNLDRLVYQISDYYKVFSHVYIVTTEQYYYPVYKTISKYYKNIGIIVLTNRNRLSIKRKSIINNDDLDYLTLFKLLRKNEYQNLIMKYYDVPDNIRPVDHFDNYFYYFKLLEKTKAQKEVLKTIKKRYLPNPTNYIEKIPKEVNWLIYSANLSDKNYTDLLNKIY